MNTDYDVPPYPDQGFIDTANAEFKSAIYALAPGESPEAEDYQLDALRARVAYNVERWLDRVSNDPIKWKANVRVVNALRAGIVEGTVALNNQESLNAMDFIVTDRLWLFPQLVEYYVERGEFMDLISAVKDSTYSASILLNKIHTLSAAKLYRLYSWDVENDHARSHGGDHDFSVLPLEMRLNFSDFYSDEVNREELYREHVLSFPLDHTDKNALL